MNRISRERKRVVGITTTLGKNIVGSPPYLKNMYENAMSIIGATGNPDLFITFTGNPKWPEIEVSEDILSHCRQSHYCRE